MEKNQEFTLLFQPPATMHFAEEHKKTFLRKKIAMYIHIPFCEKKCFFCSIVTCQKYTDDYIESYVKVLEKEIYDHKDYFRINKVGSIHIGGGTPSLLNENQVERVFRALDECVTDFSQVEVVFESEASSLSDEKINFLSSLGHVSLNMGVQTFDGKVIRKINRWSSPERIIDRLELARSKNFRAVGIDVMCNLPYATVETTLADIDMTAKLGVNHVSLYPLRVEPDSIFHDYQNKYENSFIKEEEQLGTYSAAAEYLRTNGYDHYSIFHFSNQKEETYLYSRNQMYGGEWIGLGVAAYSYYNSAVFSNTRDLDEYIQFGNQPNSRMWFQEENNALKDIIRQFVFSLRMTNITRAYYFQKYGASIYSMFFAPIIKYLSKKGFIAERNGAFQLSDLGIVNFPAIESDILDNYDKIIYSEPVKEEELSV